MRDKTPKPELEIHYLPVDSLVPYAQNAKEHPERQIDQIAMSIREFGNCDPIAVWHDEDGEPIVVEGHGRLLALKLLEAKEAPVIYLDHLSDAQRRAYTHVHNQTTLSSGFDLEVLEAEIQELDQFDWEQFGFPEEKYDPDSMFMPDSPDEGNGKPKEPITCPNCGYVFEDD